MSSKTPIETLSAYASAYGQLDGAIEAAEYAAVRHPWDTAEVLAKLAKVRAEVQAQLAAGGSGG